MAIETSTIKVLADTTQAQKALGNLHTQLSNIGKVVVGAAIVQQFNKVAEGIDAINKSAQKFGISSASMDALAKSAELAGIDFAELTAGLQKFQQNLGDALIKGTGPAAAGLAMLGLKAKELADLPVNEQLLKIKDALSGIENPALKAAIGVDILGKQGLKLLKTADDAQRLKQRFKEIGLELSDVDTQGVENALDRVKEVLQVVEGGFRKLVANIAPYVEAVARAILFIVDNFGGPIVTALAAATRALIAFMAVLAVGKIIQAITWMVEGFIALRGAILGAEGAAIAFNFVLKANPLMRIATIAATIAAIFGGPILDAASKLLGIEQQTADEVERRKKATQGNAEADRILVALKKLQFELESDIVPQIEEQVRLMKIKNSLGDAAYENEKAIGEAAKRYNISLEEARSVIGDSLASKYQELDLQNKINAAVMAGRQETARGGYGGALSGAMKAQADLRLSQKTTDQEAIAGNESRLKREIANYAASIDEQYALRQAYDNKLIALDDYAYMLRSQGYTTESEEYRAMLSAKETAFGEHVIKLAEMDRQRFEQSKMMELQGQQYSQFGYDTKKQMAQEAANFEKKSDMEKYAFGLDQAAQMYTQLGTYNKQAFEAAKAFNIANAIMNTYMGATKALATYPFPFGLIAAAGAVAAGMAQVAMIRSQSYSGRALGGPVMGNNPYIVGENGPELFVPQGTGSIVRNGDLGQGGGATINFNIQANDAQGFDDLLHQRRGMITQFVRDAMTEQGQRSRM